MKEQQLVGLQWRAHFVNEGLGSILVREDELCLEETQH